MRYINSVQQKHGRKWVMLVERPSDPRYSDGIVAYYYLDLPGELPDGGEFFAGCTVQEVKEHLAHEYEVPLTTWIEVPNQPDGERDDRLPPLLLEP